MKKRLGVVMNPIADIFFKKDTTLALLLEASARGFELYYFEAKDLFVRDGESFGVSKRLAVFDDANHWFSLSDEKTISLSTLDMILMRVDPPFNLHYIYLTYILELAEKAGVQVVNRPASLRDCNEKCYIAQFPDCTPPTLITSNPALLKAYLDEHQDIVCKSLSGMGGVDVVRVTQSDEEHRTQFDALTFSGKVAIMAQRYLPEIVNGDKRILIIHGEPVPLALARIPAKNDWRGNLAQGATGVMQPLTPRDYFICEALRDDLNARGLAFVGIDVIGDYLTEINVTSPTCLREIQAGLEENIAGRFFEGLK